MSFIEQDSGCVTVKSLSMISTFLAGAVAALVFVLLRHSSAPVPAESVAPRAETETDTPAGARALARARDDERPERARLREPESGREMTDRAAVGADGAREEAVAEFRRMSDGYRSRVFLRAIRQQGHYCDGVLGMQLGGGDVAAWRVDCRGADAYLVGVDSGGALVVEPLFFGDPGLVGPRPPEAEPAPPTEAQ